MATVRFDEPTHKYWVTPTPGAAEVIWPSVTTVCGRWKAAVTGRLAPWDDPNCPAEFAAKVKHAAEKGTVTHHAIALDLSGGLDWASLDPAIIGYMEAYRKAKSHLRLGRPIVGKLRCEEVLVGEGYCGTADLITGRYLLDWKTGRHDWTHWMQLAAYRKCLPGLRDAGCCYLASDGSYEIKWMPKDEYSRSWRWFWAALDLLECQGAHTKKGNGGE
jgi:hypothetical protein